MSNYPINLEVTIIQRTDSESGTSMDRERDMRHKTESGNETAKREPVKERNVFFNLNTSNMPLYSQSNISS